MEDMLSKQFSCNMVLTCPLILGSIRIEKAVCQCRSDSGKLVMTCGLETTEGPVIARVILSIISIEMRVAIGTFLSQKLELMIFPQWSKRSNISCVNSISKMIPTII